MEVILGARSEFTRRQYLLYEALMDGGCTLDEAFAVVRGVTPSSIPPTTLPSGSPGRQRM